MRMSSKMTLALSALIVLGLLVAFAGLFGARYVADIGRPSAAVSLAPVQAVVDSPLLPPAHPTEEIVVITPPPEGGVIVLEPGKVYVFPSPTPFPIWTPRPTPTRRPGPTTTPMPLPKPAPNAEGDLYFTSYTFGDNQQRQRFCWLARRKSTKIAWLQPVSNRDFSGSEVYPLHGSSRTGCSSICL
ncbi:MAG: hypothetical protein ACK47M_10205 [Caldilinea sp.]